MIPSKAEKSQTLFSKITILESYEVLTSTLVSNIFLIPKTCRDEALKNCLQITIKTVFTAVGHSV